MYKSFALASRIADPKSKKKTLDTKKVTPAIYRKFIRRKYAPAAKSVDSDVLASYLNRTFMEDQRKYLEDLKKKRKDELEKLRNEQNLALENLRNNLAIELQSSFLRPPVGKYYITEPTGLKNEITEQQRIQYLIDNPAKIEKLQKEKDELEKQKRENAKIATARINALKRKPKKRGSRISPVRSSPDSSQRISSSSGKQEISPIPSLPASPTPQRAPPSLSLLAQKQGEKTHGKTEEYLNDEIKDEQNRKDLLNTLKIDTNLSSKLKNINDISDYLRNNNLGQYNKFSDFLINSKPLTDIAKKSKTSAFVMTRRNLQHHVLRSQPQSGVKKKGGLVSDSRIENAGAVPESGTDGILYDSDIRVYMEPLRKYGFLDVYMADEIKNIPIEHLQKRGSLIMNIDPNLDPTTGEENPGTHWVSIFYDLTHKNHGSYEVHWEENPNNQGLFYYDSFGRPPSDQTLKDTMVLMNKIREKFEIDYETYFRYSNHQQQDIKSQECGYFAMLFLINMYDNIPFDNIIDIPLEEREKEVKTEIPKPSL